MNQPVPKIQKEDVIRIINREFPTEMFTEVEKELNKYGLDKYEVEAERVRMAILKLAKGNMTELERYVQIAKIDFRDVLLYAEYPLCSKNIFAKDVSKKEDIYKKDLDQYQAWLNKI